MLAFLSRLFGSDRPEAPVRDLDPYEAAAALLVEAALVEVDSAVEEEVDSAVEAEEVDAIVEVEVEAVEVEVVMIEKSSKNSSGRKA